MNGGFTVPEPTLRTTPNLTPFVVFAYDKMGPGRRFFDVVVVKGTFALTAGPLRLAPTQRDVVFADTYLRDDAPERGGLREAGDVVLCKPTTDVFVTGTARAPHGRAVARWSASVCVQRGALTLAKHTVNVTGPRVWRRTADRSWTLSEPTPTDAVPVRHELAWGGAWPDRDDPTRWTVHRPNPAGLGFVDPHTLTSPDAPDTLAAPQWELPDAPVTVPNAPVEAAGFGPIARWIPSRLAFAGTYDDAWKQQCRDDLAQGLPVDYPADFDARFFQCAPPPLVMPAHLAGDETVTLAGLTGEGDALTFALPSIAVEARLTDDAGTWFDEALPLDTVHIDLDAREVMLTWRLVLDPARGIHNALVCTAEPLTP